MKGRLGLVRINANLLPMDTLKGSNSNRADRALRFREKPCLFRKYSPGKRPKYYGKNTPPDFSTLSSLCANSLITSNSSCVGFSRSSVRGENSTLQTRVAGRTFCFESGRERKTDRAPDEGRDLCMREDKKTQPTSPARAARRRRPRLTSADHEILEPPPLERLRGIDQLLSTRDIEQIIDRHRCTIYRWVRAGTFPSKRAGGGRGWLRSDVERWLEGDGSNGSR